MSENETTREIKPRSEVPASHENITSNIPDRTLSTSLASDLIGMRQAHFKKVVRDALDESIGSTATLQQIADVYSISRPAPSVLSQRHFTTEEGINGLLSLIEYLASDGSDRDDSLNINSVYQGSCLDHFREFPEESVQTVITSPPYWGMRVYSKEFNIDWSDGTTSAFGGESTPEQYIRNTLELFLRMRPILNDTGTIWWNVGDVYNTRTEIRETSLERMTAVATNEERTWADLDAKRHSAGHEYLKDKDLTLIPYQIAKGLERCGFYVRSVIAWRKQNVIPETVTDRPTVGHELILLVSKSKSYKFNETRWREFRDESLGARSSLENENLRTVWDFEQEDGEISKNHDGEIAEMSDTRPIWEMAPAKGEYQHAAPFPLELPGRCITLATDSDSSDVVYDPFLGSGTTSVAAAKLNRPWVGSEISPEYKELIQSRLDSQVGEDWNAHSRQDNQTLDEFTDE